MIYSRHIRYPAQFSDIARPWELFSSWSFLPSCPVEQPLVLDRELLWVCGIISKFFVVLRYSAVVLSLRLYATFNRLIHGRLRQFYTPYCSMGHMDLWLVGRSIGNPLWSSMFHLVICGFGHSYSYLDFFIAVPFFIQSWAPVSKIGDPFSLYPLILR